MKRVSVGKNEKNGRIRHQQPSTKTILLISMYRPLIQTLTQHQQHDYFCSRCAAAWVAFTPSPGELKTMGGEELTHPVGSSSPFMLKPLLGFSLASSLTFSFFARYRFLTRRLPHHASSASD
eukprot:gene1953-1191_t